MRHRPIRKNYGIGVYGDISYLERLERYCTFLEKKQKQLTMRDVSKSVNCEHVRGSVLLAEGDVVVECRKCGKLY